MHITSLQQTVSAQQNVSYDGTFLWKICDVSQKLREAATGQRGSQYSPGKHAHTHTLPAAEDGSACNYKTSESFILSHVVKL